MENTISYKAYLKSPFNTIKHNTYFEVYDSLLARFIGTSFTFVEIGVLGGGSLFMWREFFGPKARIIGIDLNPNAKKWEKEGFEIFIGSQSDEGFWRDFVEKIGDIDVILDDGGHTYLQQITTCEMMLPYIRQNGMIIVEDTHTSYLNGFGPHKFSFINYSKGIIDKINLRSGRLNSKAVDKRVWSVQTFDSVIVFHINHQAAGLPSQSTTNHGENDGAIDFRHNENIYYSKFQSSKKYFRIFKLIPGVKVVAALVRTYIQNHTGSTIQLKKYFK